MDKKTKTPGWAGVVERIAARQIVIPRPSVETICIFPCLLRVTAFVKGKYEATTYPDEFMRDAASGEVKVFENAKEVHAAIEQEFAHRKAIAVLAVYDTDRTVQMGPDGQTWQIGVDYIWHNGIKSYVGRNTFDVHTARHHKYFKKTGDMT